MPNPNQDTQRASNVVNIKATEASQIMSNIRDLRQRILAAWHERGVTLTSEERRELKSEITYTCELLTVLTSRD